ncbi:MAG: FkbM family methyltransferase [Methylocella sp.]
MIVQAIDTLDFATRIYMRMRSWVAPAGIAKTFLGFKMYCDTRDFIQRRIFYFGMFEPNLTYYMMSQLHASDHVVDIGANVGYITLLVSHIVGDSGRVVSIEASPTTFALLSRNLKLNETSNVLALNMAATGEPCEVEIVAGGSRNSGSNSIQRVTGRSATVVKGDALSNLAAVDKERLKFIKIDIEGSETPVLQDILNNLHRYPKLRNIAVEMSPASANLVPLFVAAGFRVYALPNNYSIGYLFVREYLRRSKEDGFVVKKPIDAYDASYTDYVFERA